MQARRFAPVNAQVVYPAEPSEATAQRAVIATDR